MNEEESKVLAYADANGINRARLLQKYRDGSLSDHELSMMSAKPFVSAYKKDPGVQESEILNQQLKAEAVKALMDATTAKKPYGPIGTPDTPRLSDQGYATVLTKGSGVVDGAELRKKLGEKLGGKKPSGQKY